MKRGDGENPSTSEKMVKMTIPSLKVFALPILSVTAPIIVSTETSAIK
jgi:hypothetical protein